MKTHELRIGRLHMVTSDGINDSVVLRIVRPLYINERVRDYARTVACDPVFPPMEMDINEDLGTREPVNHYASELTLVDPVILGSHIRLLIDIAEEVFSREP